MRSDPNRLALLLAVLALETACSDRHELLGSVRALAGDAGVPTQLEYSPPKLIAELASPENSDEDATFTGDLLELFFVSDRQDNKDIWSSRRESVTAPWTSPVRVTELNSSVDDVTPYVSLDGLRIWFSSGRGEQGRRTWFSSRPSLNEPWATPVPVPELAGTYGLGLTAAETFAVVCATREGGAGEDDIYFSTRGARDEAWGPLQSLRGVNTSQGDLEPFVAEAGRVVFLSSTRQGSEDLYWARRGRAGEAFPEPVALSELNSSESDTDPTVSQDLGYLIFTSWRSGTRKLYEAYRVR
ncbi:MAG TPA: hypothetical protein VER33_26585 [Polyangiaceae bacterium]|nr:hypothetical protein [Polyangiaceae bacterium]